MNGSLHLTESGTLARRVPPLRLISPPLSLSFVTHQYGDIHEQGTALRTTRLFSGIFCVNSAVAAANKIGILVFDGFLTSDVTAPIEVFGAATKKAWFSSYEVVVVSASKNKEVRSEEGLKIIADKTIYDELKLDVLLVPSAYEMDAFLKNKDLIQFIKKQNQSASWMASNCSGAFLLGEAGVLDGKNATTW
ncbi:MAG: DJ-1/PfpI family protein, partial [Gammaproteobacteria bacterium]|nr:DJ-1/PfpI family protein [Gammaproteobacteria bacterium]